jgi:2,3-bisphosphoglycerate-dependent phosphoglycerate mutase
MQLYFIRHGQSTNNELWLRTGASEGHSDDPPLTSVGRQQAQHLAQVLRDGGSDSVRRGRDSQNLAGFGVTHVFASLMVRAVATAAIIAEALGLPVVAWEALHETGGPYLTDKETGQPRGMPGKNRAFFQEHYPDLLLPEGLGDGGWWDRPFETQEQRQARAERFLADLLERHGSTDDRVAVVSHAGFYNHVMRTLLEPRTQNGCWFVLDNAAITRIDFHPEGVDLVYLNRADFLPRQLVT